ncbi:MAG TPA: peptidylprolyl isomerase [Gammaproteobacteria bacterium]|nr:peptidylprolyl isomerase [Gammaproteobacteria bacterium]
MKVAKHTVVSLEYTLTGEDGEVIDSSQAHGPLVYLHGAGNLIPGVEKALEGRTAGEQLTVTVAPADGYGERDEALVQDVPRELFEGVDRIEPGMRFHAMSDHGPRVVTVTAVTGDRITVDGNHPLAGQTLYFDLTVVDVRDATLEEIAHGHAHGPHDHDH